jgi:hypothetical protein
MVSYNCALDIDTAFLAGHHRRPRTAPVAWVALIEAAWAPLGPEVIQARQALAVRVPGSGPGMPVVADALQAFLDSLAGRCRGLPGDELTSLDRVLERTLYDIDRADIQAVTDGSDDGFLYARGFIIAMGRDFYDAVASEPEMAVPDAECEEMCYFFAHQYRERFGDFPDTGSGISRESCSNQAGPADAPIARLRPRRDGSTIRARALVATPADETDPRLPA